MRRAIRPGLVSRAAGRRRRSAARRISIISPPRERQIASRPGRARRAVLVIRWRAPAVTVPDVAGPGRRAGGRGAGLRGAWARLTVQPWPSASARRALGPRPHKDLLPPDPQRPPAITVRDGLAVPEAPGMPRAARPGPEEDPVDHRPVIGAPATPGQMHRQKPAGFSLLLERVMTLPALHRASR